MKIDIEQGRRLVEDATRGPWESVRTSPDRGDHVRMVEGPVVRADGRKFIPIIAAVAPVADADAIVWLRNNATALLDAAEREASIVETERIGKDVEGAIERTRLEVERLTLALHEHRAHPDYEYETTRGPWKGETVRPDGDGWEDNVCRRNAASDPVVGLDYHSCWERHDFYDEHHWRRRRTEDKS